MGAGVGTALVEETFTIDWRALWVTVGATAVVAGVVAALTEEAFTIDWQRFLPMPCWKAELDRARAETKSKDRICIIAVIWEEKEREVEIRMVFQHGGSYSETYGLHLVPMHLIPMP